MKAYCENCKFYQIYQYPAKAAEGLILSDTDCFAPANLEIKEYDNYRKHHIIKTRISSAKIINKHNDCVWYERKTK